MKISKEEFKRLREKVLKLTQDELATKLGVHKMTISMKERGIRRVQRSDIYSLKYLIEQTK